VNPSLEPAAKTSLFSTLLHRRLRHEPLRSVLRVPGSKKQKPCAFPKRQCQPVQGSALLRLKGRGEGLGETRWRLGNTTQIGTLTFALADRGAVREANRYSMLSRTRCCGGLPSHRHALNQRSRQDTHPGLVSRRPKARAVSVGCRLLDCYLFRTALPSLDDLRRASSPLRVGRDALWDINSICCD